MKVLLTGSYGTCGTAVLDHLYDREEYDITCFNRSDRPKDHPYGGYETIVGNVTDSERIREATEECDAIVHLAACPSPGADWEEIFEPNIIGTYNVLEAAKVNEVGTVVFASTNHVMGGYEDEFSPALYKPGHGIALTHTDPVRPDSYYGASKSFGEDLGRTYIETHEFPERFYALRICSVRSPEYDHPYGDAERGVDEDSFERGCPEYERNVARMKGMWQSRRDFAHQVDCCLRQERKRETRPDPISEFDIFNGVSDNLRRWFDLEHARTTIGYHPQDDAEEFTEPPK